MISEAILTLKDRTGSSQQAIAKFIGNKYKKVLPPNFSGVLSVQLKKFVKSERLLKIKNSFKISSADQRLKSAVKDTHKTKGTGKKTRKAVTPMQEKTAKKIAEKMVKTKRLSKVKTPEKNPKKKMKKKSKTPMKRKGTPKTAGSSARSTKKSRN